MWMRVYADSYMCRYACVPVNMCLPKVDTDFLSLFIFYTEAKVLTKPSVCYFTGLAGHLALRITALPPTC